MHKQDGTEYEARILSGFQGIFQRHLHDKGSLIKILNWITSSPSPERFLQFLLPNERIS